MKKKIQLIIDITMAVLLPLLMAYSLIGEAFLSAIPDIKLPFVSGVL